MASLLYGGALALASEPPASPKPAAAAPEPPKVVAHIALLLPAKSATFGRSADAVMHGFLAAAKTHGKVQLPIRLYPLSDDPQSALASYREALAAGARVAVGPLTRNDVTALAGSKLVTIPTLALNVPERSMALPASLVALSLQVEAEARQVAALAAREGRVNAVTVVGDTPLLRRIHQAFVEEFVRGGGKHLGEHVFTSDLAQLARIKRAVSTAGADMAFLAVDFQRARTVRPYLGALPLYATSHIYPGAIGTLASFDLANVRFLDMPWILQPDHPAVAIYPRPAPPLANLELERLYALGIDAFRIAEGLLEGKNDPLDGVTGRLTLRGDRHYARELTRAQFSDGKLVVQGDAP